MPDSQTTRRTRSRIGRQTNPAAFFCGALGAAVSGCFGLRNDFFHATALVEPVGVCLENGGGMAFSVAGKPVFNQIPGDWVRRASGFCFRSHGSKALGKLVEAMSEAVTPLAA